MFKVSPTFHNGINFVQISSLPFDQKECFKNWIPMNSVLRMEINSITLSDCVEYSEYEYWFDYQYKKAETRLEISL
jgi:hypothetical protein